MFESLHVLTNFTTKKPANSTWVHIAYANACALCNEDHFLQRCDLFCAKTPADHEAFVRHKKICLNCLGYNKSPMCHSDNKCRKCNEKHNTSLQFLFRMLLLRGRAFDGLVELFLGAFENGVSLGCVESISRSRGQQSSLYAFPA